MPHVFLLPRADLDSAAVINLRNLCVTSIISGVRVQAGGHAVRLSRLAASGAGKVCVPRGLHVFTCLPLVLAEACAKTLQELKENKGEAHDPTKGPEGIAADTVTF
jgi:hypothetical protein